ncbi:MAG: hypothetical protein GX491_18565 [Chloroflexi bacterium]|nr:hypothetical protein [Chloroflexota bacterium]
MEIQNFLLVSGVEQEFKMKNLPLFVLAVEDDPDDRYLMECEVQSHPGEVQITFVSTCRELCDFLIACSQGLQPAGYPDLILLTAFARQFDIQGAMECLETCTGCRDIPVFVLVETEFEKEYIQSTSTRKIKDFLVKPVTVERLMSLLPV